jgi:hypothetical protein
LKRAGTVPSAATVELGVPPVPKAKPYKRKVATLIIGTAVVSFPLMVIAFRALT